MPKGKVATRPEDVPLWDELVAETRDPRPYEPIKIPPSYPFDEVLFMELEAQYLDAMDLVDVAVDDLSSDLDDVQRDCVEYLDAIIAEFEEKYGPLPPTQSPVDQSTAYTPALSTLDVEATLVLPVWPHDGENGVKS